jgi:hypothetical protein
VVSLVGYIKITNKPTGSDNWQLSDKTMTLSACTIKKARWGLYKTN